MSERPGARKERDARSRAYVRELNLRSTLRDDEAYLSETKLVRMLNTITRLRDKHKGEGAACYQIDCNDLEVLIKETLKWRRGMLNRHEIKRYFAR